MSFLAEMSLRLATAIETLDPTRRTAHGRFIIESMRPDGGFAGRQGPSDLYYTSFGLRCLALLAVDSQDWAKHASQFLHTRLTPEPVGIDALSWILSATLLEAVTGTSPFETANLDRAETIRRWCHALRRPDGAYGKTPTAAVASTYQTFLATACLEMIEEAGHEKKNQAETNAVSVILSRKQTDGGFVEIPQVRSSGTNPTAAALSFLQIQDALSDEVRDRAVHFLASMQTGNGGLLAHSKIPFPDLLSTFTSLLTLDRLGALDTLDRHSAARFVKSLERPEGGFLAGHGDTAPDVEYTFYGLGSLAILGL